MGIIYRQSDLNKVPAGADFDNSYWHYFLVLEQDFKKTLQFIHLEKENLETYSLEYAKQLICISTEFETIAKLLCNKIDGSKPGNMGQYKEIILGKYSKIWSTPVYVDYHNQMEFYPLKPWEQEGGKLDWWTAYNNVKHERHRNFNNATLKNVLDALGALLIFETYLYKTAFGKTSGIRFGTSILRVPELAETVYYQKGKLPDF